MFVRVGDLDIHVQVSGAGAPLLLLHSLGTNLHIWDAQAEALSRHFRVIRPDLRGHGLTSVTPGPYSMAQFARDALGLLDALGVHKAHVAGISIGGLISQAIAHEAPGRVLSLGLVDTALAIPPAQNWHDRAALVRKEGMTPLVEAVVARWVTEPSFQTPAANGLRAMLRRTDPEGYAGAAEAIAAADLTEQTKKLRIPTLVIVGDGDLATPVSSAEALRDAIPGAALVVLDKAAHIPTVEVPEAVTAAMVAFLLPKVSGYDAGLTIRKSVLGEAHVARASQGITEMDAAFQEWITANVWGGVWTRPGLTRKERSLLCLGMMAALARDGEFALHVRATRNTGVTPAEISEVLLQVGAYAGVPAANHALKIAKQILAEMEAGA